jgi:hypothetical protein
VSVHNPLRRATIALAFSFVLLVPNPVLAYGGPGAGLELVGYFMALLTWMGAAFGAILMWPVYNLLRRFRGAKADAKEEGNHEPAAANAPELPGEGSQNNP